METTETPWPQHHHQQLKIRRSTTRRASLRPRPQYYQQPANTQKLRSKPKSKKFQQFSCHKWSQWRIAHQIQCRLGLFLLFYVSLFLSITIVAMQ